MRSRLRVVRPPEEEPRPADHASADDDRSLDAEVDRILEKISRSGESSLSAGERETLTRASRRLKQRQQ